MSPNSLGSMGQVILGFRSLIIKLALFFLFAALLAWALGGTLFPRPEVIEFDSILFGGHRWYWKVSVGGRDPGKGRMIWQFMKSGDEEESPTVVGATTWVEAAGPVVVGESLYFGALASRNPNEFWRIERIDESLEVIEETLMPDRLAVERQLARLAEGLTLQDKDAILAQRSQVLDPPVESADEEAEH